MAQNLPIRSVVCMPVKIDAFDQEGSSISKSLRYRVRVWPLGSPIPVGVMSQAARLLRIFH